MALRSVAGAGAHASCHGQADAIAILIRRTDRAELSNLRQFQPDRATGRRSGCLWVKKQLRLPGEIVG
jgi:hypothetical protein